MNHQNSRDVPANHLTVLTYPKSRVGIDKRGVCSESETAQFSQFASSVLVLFLFLTERYQRALHWPNLGMPCVPGRQRLES